MNCETVQELLPLRHCGELTGEAREAVELHLSSCESCRQALAADRELDDALRIAMLEHSLDVSAVLQRVHVGMASSGWKSAFRLLSLRAIALAAMVAVCAFIGFSLFHARQVEKGIALAAANDHYSDLVLLRHPDWAYRPGDVARFMQEQFPRQDLLTRMTPSGTSLEKVRLCNVGGTLYAHFVFRSGSTETSVFLLANDQARGRPGPVHLADAGHGLEVSGFSSHELTGLVVGYRGQVPTQEIANRLATRL